MYKSERRKEERGESRERLYSSNIIYIGYIAYYTYRRERNGREKREREKSRGDEMSQEDTTCSQIYKPKSISKQ